MRVVKLSGALAAFLILSTACTTVERINRPDGSLEYLIACGAATGWNVCYNRANSLCPGGYETLAEDGGFNRKELWISCPSPLSDSE